MINLVIHTKSFGETLLLDYALLLAILLPIYIYANRPLRKKEEPIQIPTKKNVYTKYFEALVIALTIAIALLGVLPINSITRPKTYFALQGIVAALVTYLYLTRRLRRPILLFYLTTALATIPAIVYYRNLYYPIYDVTKEALYQTGSIRPYMEEAVRGGFYYYIPVDSLKNVAIAYSIGIQLSKIVPIVSAVTIYLVIFSSSVSTTRYLSSLGLALLALFFVNTPNLAFYYRVLSLPYASIMIYVLARSLKRDEPQLLLIALIATITMVFTHPVGPLALLLSLAYLAAFSRIVGTETQLQRVATRLLVIVLVISLVYWFTTYTYTLLVPKATRTGNALLQFINTLLGRRRQAAQIVAGETISPISAPGYSKPEFYTFAYNWALPVALITISFIILFNVLRRRRAQLKTAILMSMGLAAITYITSAYIGYALNIEPGQYMIPTGYFLAAYASAILLDKYRTKLLSLIVVIAIIGLAVGLGTYTPSWAPLEHPDFEAAARIHQYQSYIETGIIMKHLSTRQITIYSDYDILIATGKSARAAIYKLLVKLNPESLSTKPYTLVILKTSRLNENTAKLNRLVDITYWSTYHIVYQIR